MKANTHSATAVKGEGKSSSFIISSLFLLCGLLCLFVLCCFVYGIVSSYLLIN